MLILLKQLQSYISMEELSSVLNASHLQDMPSIDEAIAEGTF